MLKFIVCFKRNLIKNKFQLERMKGKSIAENDERLKYYLKRRCFQLQFLAGLPEVIFRSPKSKKM
jgi:hypothetical protein